MPDKHILAAVSYANTKPFLYGLQASHSDAYVQIELLPPSNLAEALKQHKAQIGLVPIAALPELPDFEVFGSYGIGSLGEVASVCAFSHVPIEQCKYVLLDYQSRSSIALMQVLLKAHWHLDLPVVAAQPGYENDVPNDAIAVIIGDRALEARTRFAYIYDLATEWKKHTGLPFVFAAWVAHKSVPADVLQKLNDAFAYGVAHIDEAIAHYKLHFDHYDVHQYMHHNLYFPIGDEQNKARTLFLQYCAQWLTH